MTSQTASRLDPPRHFWVIVMVAVAALAIGACAAPAGQPASGARPIKIGALLSTTGPIGALGSDELAGAQVFVDEINARGGINGRQIQLIHVDDEGKPEQALSGAKRLLQQEGVLVLIGPSSNLVVSPVAPVLEEAKVPAVSGVGNIGPLTPYVFTVFPFSGSTDTIVAWQKSKGLANLAVITQAGTQAEALRTSTMPFLERSTTVVGFELLQPSDTDATPILAKLRSGGAQLVFGSVTGQQAAIIAKNFKQINYPGAYVTHAANANDAFINLVGDAADVVNIVGTKIYVYKDLPDTDAAKARLTDFGKKFVAKASREPTVPAAVGYDMMLSLTEAIKSAGEDPQKIRDTLENQRGVRGLNGVINRSASEHNGLEPDWLMMQVDQAGKRFTLPK